MLLLVNKDILPLLFEFLPVKDLVTLYYVQKKMISRQFGRELVKSLMLNLSKLWFIDTQDISQSTNHEFIPTCACFAREFPNKLVANDISLSVHNTCAAYWGIVGSGTRSIKSNVPFPILKKAPCSMNLYFQSMKQIYENRNNQRKEVDLIIDFFIDDSTFSFSAYFISMYTQLQKTYSKLQIESARQFSIPFALRPSHYFLSPRRVAYYEVAFQSISIEDFNTEGILSGVHPPSISSVISQHDQDCLAVGLCSPQFKHTSRLPGWDRESFGYHGDDGGAFHGQGTRVRDFGPKFGFGDTIGCGLDYVLREIFFTLNGRFLGPAFRGLALTESLELSPCVGMDCNAKASFNFGKEPFQFPLLRYIQQSEEEQVRKGVRKGSPACPLGPSTLSSQSSSLPAQSLGDVSEGGGGGSVSSQESVSAESPRSLLNYY